MIGSLRAFFTATFYSEASAPLPKQSTKATICTTSGTVLLHPDHQTCKQNKTLNAVYERPKAGRLSAKISIAHVHWIDCLKWGFCTLCLE